MGFDGRTCGVTISIGAQSPDIAQGVDTALEVRLGHQRRGHPQRPGRRRPGHDVRLRLRRDRRPDAACRSGWPTGWPSAWPRCARSGVLPYLRPDGKTQVTFEYEDGRPVRLKTVLISTQHSPNIDLETLLLPDLRDHVIAPLVPAAVRRATTTRSWPTPPGSSSSAAPTPTPASPAARSSWTPTAGRPATAAGPSPGKDPSKVDRSAAYAARWVAKHVVAAGAAPALRDPGGVRHRGGPPGVPAGRDVRDRRPSTRTASSTAVDDVFDLRPAAIIRDLDLRRPIYRKTAAYGHFGRADKEFSWEQRDPARRLQVGAGAVVPR